MTITLRESPSQYFDERADGSLVDTVVIHSMCNPAHTDPTAAQSCVELLEQCQLSAHFLIDRSGEVWRLVPEGKRAWHAGVSEMHDGRSSVNHFSIGIELLGMDGTTFTDAQYQSLAELVGQLRKEFPLQFVVGHEHIARPLGRKVDPGPLFDWVQLRTLLDLNSETQGLQFPFIVG